MLKNYLLTTFRNISRRKGFSILNVLGLSIGLAASLLILQYVKDELSYDDFHVNADRIYRVEFDAYREGKQIFKCATAFPKVAPTLKATFPEIEDATRLYLRYGGGVIRYEDISIKEDNLFQAEQNFFSIFSYPLTDGTAKLDQPNTAIIEEVTARKYFGDQSPIGKRVRLGDNEEYEITGVMHSPENSHLKFTFLLSYPTLVTLWGEQFENAWGWYDFYNYVLLKPGSSASALEAKLPPYIEKNGTREGESERTRFVLQHLPDIHLYSDLIQEARVNGNGRTVYFLLIIALFILVIAWVNYINLSTARAIERAKEVGVRKAIGAAKKQLVGQFLSEALMVNLFAALIGVMLVCLSIPLFNEIAGKNLTFSIFRDPNLWIALSVLFLFGTLLSGLYPAFVLSAFQPVKVLKGSLKGTREGLFLRKALVTIQFVFSVGLITGTIIVYRQLQYMTNQHLGIDIDQTVLINGPGYLQADSLYNTYLNGFRNAVNNQSTIRNFTVTTEVPGNLIFWTNGAIRIGDDVTKRNMMYIMGVDNNFFQTFGNKFLAGRPYSPEFTGDSSSVILNRKAVEMFNLTSPENAIGQRISLGRDTLNIVGVVENYHQEGLRQDFRPTAFRLMQSARSYFCVKVSANDLDDALAMLKTQYATIFPNNPFDYFFLDSFFNRQYRNEKQFGSVFSFFAMLAIFVACLGLFGLASFTAAQRTKEIGIRKVLGSSVPNIFLLLSRDFLILVIVANIIAVPLVWILMEKWLNSFAFRIEMNVWFFGVSAVITFLIALLTVSYQSINAAVANPVKSLRYE
jgi:putative ABC transport system permease protein